MKGFTLIELMLVVIIIGILASVVVPRFVGRSEEARRVAAETALDRFGLSLDMFELDNGRYPTTEQGLEALLTKPRTIPELKNWKGPYIKKPKFNDPWGTPYIYKYPGERNPQEYELFSTGPDGKEGGGDDIPRPE